MNIRLIAFLAAFVHGTLAPSAWAQVYEKLFSFSDARKNRPGELAGKYPEGGLMLDIDGRLYGSTSEGGSTGDGTLFAINPDGTIETLFEFVFLGPENEGAQPRAQLLRGGNGSLYGITGSGGNNGTSANSGHGTVFSISPQGAVTTLVRFTRNGTSNKGRGPRGLVAGSDGNFYGTTDGGGTTSTTTFIGNGTIFRMTPAGTLTTLVNLSGNGSTNKGETPQGLVVGGDGNFYGVCRFGGTNDLGTIFRMTPAGTLTTLVNFSGNGAANKGGEPRDLLCLADDGNFYGVTSTGGANDAGTIFKVSPAGELVTLVEFTGTAGIALGSEPMAGLVQGGDGHLYGSTNRGGANDEGTLFRVSKTGTLTTLVEFTRTGPNANGARPQAPLIAGADGDFYGTTREGGARDFGTVFKVTESGVLTTVVEFNETPTHGEGPLGLVVGQGGIFYGVTDAFRSETPETENGTIFSATTSGDVRTLVNFSDNGPINKGSLPNRDLIQTPEGMIYGTTSYGGADGNGTVFRMTPEGELTTLFEFGTGARFPIGGLAYGADGNFYGSTELGGTQNHGTIFRMTPEGQMTTIVNFTNAGASNRGSGPQGLILASNGNFYGTTRTGASSDLGTVFRMTEAGTLTTLAQFTGTAGSVRGADPCSKLVEGPDGSIYGTTRRGGSGGVSGYGTIFKISPQGTFSTLVQFTSNGASNKGSFPEGGLTLGADGFLYGTTTAGGANGNGTIFRVSQSGTLTTLFDFTGETEDVGPEGSLVFGPDGNLYGTCAATFIGPGSYFRLVFPGAPVVEAGIGEPGLDNVRITATINPRGASTLAAVEYGTDGIDFPNSVPLGQGLSGYQTLLAGTTVRNLAPGATYHFRVRATNSEGTTLSPAMTFSTLAQPTARALPPTELASGAGPASASAKFNGAVNANGFDTSVVFEWGTDGNTFPNAVAAAPGTVTGNTEVAVSAAMAGLARGQTHFYRIVATNAAGRIVSGTQSFITLTDPVVTLGAATVVGADSATVSGIVNARGSNTTAAFEYGTDGVSFPNSITATPSAISGAEDAPVTATLTGLAQATTYHFRLKATSAGGSATTSSDTFTTLALPVVTDLAAPNPGSSTVTLRAMVNASGLETAVVFEYGSSAESLPFSVVADSGSATGSAPVAASATVSGLQPEASYFFRVRATSAAGQTLTGAINFIMAPSARAVTGVGSATLESATMSGTFNAFGQQTAIGFDYGTDPAVLDQTIVAGSGTLSGNSDSVLSATLESPVPGTRYYFRAKAANAGGTTFAQNTEFFDVPGNEVPVAVSDVFFYAGQIDFDPLENDTDGNNLPPVPPDAGLKLDEVLVVPSNASFGVASVETERTISYSPQFNVLGEDSLVYRVHDSHGGSADGHVRLISFAKCAGLYGGVIAIGSGENERRGSIAAQLTRSGAISTSFMNWPNSTEAFPESFVLKGGFDARGRLSRTFGSPSGTSLTIALALDPDNSRIVGSFEERVGSTVTASVPSFFLELNAGTGGLSEPGLRVGFFTVPEEIRESMAPGFLRMTIGKDKRRGARFAGRLPDGEPFSAGAPAQGRAYNLTRKLEQRGLLTGLVRTVDSTGSAGGIMGSISWQKPASSRARYHRGGVNQLLPVAGTAYPAIAKGELPPLALSDSSPNARLRFTGGGLDGTVRDLLLFIQPGGVSVAGPDTTQTGSDLPLEKFKLTLNGSKASFTGKFRHPDTGKVTAFEGAFTAPFDGEPAHGHGIFRAPDAAGSVRIEAIEP